MPKKYEIDYMVFALCDGDASKREWILDNMTSVEAMKWMYLGSYRNYMMDKASKRG